MPDYALLEETLARGFGLWPLPKFALILLLLVVVLPAVVPVLAVQIGTFDLNRFGRGCGLIILALLMVSSWEPGFSELDASVGGVRGSGPVPSDQPADYAP